MGRRLRSTKRARGMLPGLERARGVTECRGPPGAWEKIAKGHLSSGGFCVFRRARRPYGSGLKTTLMSLRAGRTNVAHTKRRQWSQWRAGIEHYPGHEGGVPKPSRRLKDVVGRPSCGLLNDIRWQDTAYTTLYSTSRRECQRETRLTLPAR